jgi:glycosyltransferase involved in cell wall biosynthesis
MRFATSYHTRFPEYLQRPLAGASWRLSYRYLRWFHGAGYAQPMVSTAVHGADALRRAGFRDLRPRWSRGVDTLRFRPNRVQCRRQAWRAAFVFVGRVAVEKNVEAFLATPLPGRKLVVGDGPARSTLQGRVPDARFAGMLEGATSARRRAGRAPSLMVFPESHGRLRSAW